MKLVIRLLWFIAGGLAMLLAYNWITFDSRPPISGPMVLTVTNTPINVGERAAFKATRIKVRDDCPVTAIRTLTDENGTPAFIPSSAGEGGPSSEGFIKFDLDTTELPPGLYILQTRLIYHCPGFTSDHSPNSVLFRVVDPSKLNEIEQIQSDVESLSRGLEAISKDSQ